MSVIIDMDKPKKCSECKLLIKEFNPQNYYSNSGQFNTRFKCPLNPKYFINFIATEIINPRACPLKEYKDIETEKESNMEIYKEAGKTGRVYYVFGISVKAEEAIHEGARHRKVSPSRLKTIPVYVKGNELFLERVEGGKLKVAVTGR